MPSESGNNSRTVPRRSGWVGMMVGVTADVFGPRGRPWHAPDVDLGRPGGRLDALAGGSRGTSSSALPRPRTAPILHSLVDTVSERRSTALQRRAPLSTWCWEALGEAVLSRTRTREMPRNGSIRSDFERLGRRHDPSDALGTRGHSCVRGLPFTLLARVHCRSGAAGHDLWAAYREFLRSATPAQVRYPVGCGGPLRSVVDWNGSSWVDMRGGGCPFSHTWPRDNESSAVRHVVSPCAVSRRQGRASDARSTWSVAIGYGMTSWRGLVRSLQCRQSAQLPT
jgi:hypothetical protein